MFCAAIMHPSFGCGLCIDGDLPYMGEYARSMRHVRDIERNNGDRIIFRIEHRPLELYSRALEAAGLALTTVREPVPGAETVANRPEFAKFRRVPEFLHFRAERLA